MINRVALITLLVGLSNTVLGLQIKPILDDRKVIVSVGVDSLNRIAVQGDRIAQVFGLEDDFFMETDENLGQVFIRPKQKKIINLTIITEKHVTIDLQLLTENIQAETIILKPKPVPANAELPQMSTDHANKVTALILAMARNKGLNGFTENVTNKEIIMWDKIKILQTKEYVGKNVIGEVYTITNNTSQGICMTETQFGLEKDIAGVAIKKHTLGAGESTTLYIVRHNI